MHAGSLFGDLVLSPETEKRSLEIKQLEEKLLDPSIENPQAVHNNLGLTYMGMGNILKSISAYQAALAIDENDPAVNMNLGIAYKHLGQFDKAVVYFQKSLDLLPNANEHYNLGNTFMKLGANHNGTAISHYKSALELDPRHRLTCMNLGTALKAGGLLDEAINFMEKAIAIAVEDGDDRDFNAHYNLANALFSRKNEGDLERAVEQYVIALELNSDDVDCRTNLGITYHALGRYTEAVDEFSTVIMLQPGDFGIHFNMANSLFDLKRLDEAITQFEEARILNSEHEDTVYNLGIALMEAKRYKEVVDLYTEFAENFPEISKTDATLHYNIGVAYSELQMNEESREEFTKSIEIDPDRPMSHLNLGNSLEALGDSKGAINSYKQAKELDGTSAIILRNLAFTLIENGELVEGIEELRAILKLSPNDLEISEYLEQCQAELRLEEQLKVEVKDGWEKVKEEPKNVVVRANLAMALRNNKQFGEACEQFEECLKLQPGHPQITGILEDCKAQFEEEKKEKEGTNLALLTIEDNSRIESGASPIYHPSAGSPGRDEGGLFNDDLGDEDEYDEELSGKGKSRARSFNMFGGGGKKKGRTMKGSKGGKNAKARTLSGDSPGKGRKKVAIAG